MSQFDFGNLESPLPGTTLINSNLEPWRDALHSTHSGDERPSYAVAGTIWIDNTNANWDLNVFDGSEDIKIGTIDTTNNLFIPENVGDWAGNAGGSANALTLTPTPAIAGLTAGMVFDFIVNITNTTASPTMAISGLDPETIKTNLGAGKVGAPKGSLVAGTAARILFDGTDFVLMNPRAYNVAADIATAATVNLNAATGDYLTLTGTTNVSAITLIEGQERTCRAAGIFDLINSASLVLPGDADITTAAGDVFIVRGEASGVVRVVNYMRADGTALSASGGIQESGTIATTSGSAIEFTSIPSDVKRIAINFQNVGISATDNQLIQIGDAGGIETSGYKSTAHILGTGVARISSISGFAIYTAGTAGVRASGTVWLSLVDATNNIWVASGLLVNGNNLATFFVGGLKELSDELTSIRLTPVGAATYVEGSINITYEK